VRRWEAGLSLRSLPAVHGRACIHWINLFALTHEEHDDGWRRVAWPDGGPALLQPWPQAVLLRTAADELGVVASERRRRQRQA